MNIFFYNSVNIFDFHEIEMRMIKEFFNLKDIEKILSLPALYRSFTIIKRESKEEIRTLEL